jgi:hypothetical protein
MLRYFPGVSPQYAAWLTYTLNTANLASFRYENPQAFMAETPASLFFDELTESKCRSYRTEVKMYRALEALIMNTEPKALSADQNYAVLQVCAMMDVLEEIFYGEYGVEIYSGATIYDVCEMSLTPDFLEPDVCLMYDWLMV